MSETLYSSYFVGWRWWQVLPAYPDGLQSMFHPHAWPLRSPLKTYGPPSRSDGVGIYAFTTRDHALAWHSLGCWPVRDIHVLGTVAQWGTVVLHEHGNRSEYAYPLELITWPGGPDVQPLADAYGIPWRVMEDVPCTLEQLSKSAEWNRWNSLLVSGGTPVIWYNAASPPQTWKSVKKGDLVARDQTGSVYPVPQPQWKSVRLPP